ncbi:hypothetical protein DH2020_025517 [Rehmannia glutinosa]|uniref:Uncharacterized protein n=1 Tax=Rehmannia glutinosa TaxID=99300 RepID=A0ABR0VZN4_REHGL
MAYSKLGTEAVVSGALCYFYGPYWAVRKVPGPPAMPVVGHLPLLAKYGPDVFSILAKRYGPIFRFHMGRQPLVIVADPELCREVGIKKFKYISNRSIPSPIAASPLHQKGLFFTRYNQIREGGRKMVDNAKHNIIPLPAISPRQISSHNARVHRIRHRKSRFERINLLRPLTQISHRRNWTSRVWGRFQPLQAKSHNKSNNNNKHEDDHVQQFINQHIYSTTQLKMDLSGSISIILGLIIPFLQEPFRQILKRIPGTMDWKFDRTNKNLSSRLDEIVRSRMKENHHGSKDFLSLILSARESEKAARNVFTSDYISAVTYEHLLAGSATTSFTLSCIVYLVALHLDVEKKVIKEAMRFYTVSPLVARETSAQVNIGGYVLPKGTWVWLALGVLAKDPKNFPEPEKFRPERFDPNGEEEKRRHPYANIPFGIGPRACIGQKFSLQEIKLSMIHLYRKYIFRHSPQMENPLELEYGIVLNFRHGVKVQAIKRA